MPFMHNKLYAFIKANIFLYQCLSVTSQKDDDEPDKESNETEVSVIVGATLGSILLFVILIILIIIGIAVASHVHERYVL